MRRIVRLTEEADRDLERAASWYEQQWTGLGQQFLDDVLILFEAIAEQPLLYAIVLGSTRRWQQRM